MIEKKSFGPVPCIFVLQIKVARPFSSFLPKPKKKKGAAAFKSWTPKLFKVAASFSYPRLFQKPEKS